MASLSQEMIYETRDTLTGLADQAQARETIAQWQRDWPHKSIACPMQAMMITLGRIDTVNVAFGETAGDGALVEIAQQPSLVLCRDVELALLDRQPPFELS